MAGIYIHIPFCKQKCHYCDFHFSTTYQSYYNKMIEAMINEIKQRKKYLRGEKVRTLYFGGGTPSLLKIEDVARIYKICNEAFDLSFLEEFTFELNPDDCEETYLSDLKNLGVNRLSIGIQSFDEDVLQFMNRAHTQKQSDECVRIAKKTGFEKISVDLIYGIPNVDSDYWLKTIEKALELGVDHVSAYCLTIEEGTVFGVWQSKGQLVMLEDEEELKQFDLLEVKLRNAEILRYEVSNFSKVGAESIHNSGYWKGDSYIGIGPSAHSFDRISRQWNIAHNLRYIQSKGLEFEKEELTEKDIFNERLLTGLRTVRGVSLNELNPSTNWFGKLDLELKGGRVKRELDRIFIPSEFLFQADGIAASLFI